MVSSRNAKYYLAAAVALITLFVYLPALQNDFVDWDDNDYVFENSHIRSLDMAFFRWAFLDFHSANWHPLTWLSHAIDYALWGLNPLGHHLTNIVLHAMSTFVVVILVVRLLETSRKKRTEPGPPDSFTEPSILLAAGVTGFLFGLHPVHVESVAWVAERKDVLCALFYLLSIFSYTGYVQALNGETSQQKAFSLFFRKQYLFCLAFVFLALLSKPMAVSLPFVFLILDWYPFNRIRSLGGGRSALVEKIPFVALSLATSLVIIAAQKAGGAVVSLQHVPLSLRALVAAKSPIVYLGKMVWPLDLSPFYPYPTHASLDSLAYILPIALFVGITLACLWRVRVNKVWLAAWGYYVVTLIPVLGIVQVGRQAMADRFTYLPSLGPFLIIGLVVAKVSRKADTWAKRGLIVKTMGATVLILMVVSLSYITFRQIGIWKNSMVLWNHVIAEEPGAPLAYVNRGMIFYKMGQIDRAIEDFSMAIVLDPRGSEAYLNRGMLYGKTGRIDKAIEDLEKAMALHPPHLVAYNTLVNMGAVYADAGLVDKAFDQFNRAILMDQDQAMAYDNRGMLYAITGDKERAALDFQKACDLGDSNGCIGLQGLSRGGVNFP